ncbi:Histone acetyltransferase mst2 [Colletotrichum chlorophyti]|uniref:Histone acetyltransferase n=1 Tax=Colletotrichum chlorophyti TaxID=708187 RepID=A0A1Q8S3K0_9PEZI|nr:Histone acetyltransferase mst2 [Colletotrichum chlorophyti]
MTSAQLTEEELQQSAILSDEDGEYENAPSVPAEAAHRTIKTPSMNSNTPDESHLSAATHHGGKDRNEIIIEQYVGTGDNPDEHSDLSEHELAGDDLDHNSDEDHDPQLEQNDTDDALANTRSRSSSLSEDIEEDDAEAVGAVKIRPGETDDEDAEDGESEHSDSPSESGNESDETAAWEEVAEEDEDDEEGSEDAAPNTCAFCKQDEEHDPGEDFEEFLSCVGCGGNAHQHCARENRALADSNIVSQWKCLDCAPIKDMSVDEALEDASRKHPGEKEDEPEANIGLSPSKRSTASQVARDLLPAHKGSAKPESHSVFNQLMLNDDPLDGSRVLRKRKTSSVEAEDIIMSLRKRRRHTSKDRDSSNGASTSQEVLNGIRDKETRRKLRLNPSRKSQAVTVVRRPRSMIIKMRVKPSALRRTLSRKTSNRKRSERANTATSSHGSLTTAISTSLNSTDYSYPFYSFFERETEDMKTKPYGGILSEVEADTSRTMPTNDDRRRFDEAKQKSEEAWRARLHDAHLNLGTPAKRSKKNAGPASQIECIDFGGWEIDTWYAAPYPEEYSRNRTLYICEFCLKYMNSDYVAWRHKLKCPAKHPPGDEIYRHGSVSVFEVDGRKNPVYCQNLCLLAKLFLGSKTLYYDVEPFLFYVLCEYDTLGYHFVGYFSKEKRASSQNNVSCILTLPIHQRKGYGNLLIDFSYLLTRVEHKTGSPEKPLSDMGLVSYRNYWRLVLCRYLLDHIAEGRTTAPGLSIRQISDDTGLTPDDVISALEGLRCLVRDPQTELYAFRVDLAYCTEYIAKWEAKNYVKLSPDALTWTPYVMGRGNATNFELGPAISAIAPREEDDSHKPAVEEPTAPAEAGPKGLSVHGQIDKSLTATNASAPAAADDGQNTIDWEGQAAVCESTNSHHNESMNDKSGQVTSFGKEAQYNQAVLPSDGQPSSDSWMLSYSDVPPSRFEVYPPPGGRRSDRPRPSIQRPAVPRNTSNTSRPRRSGGGSSARRPTASRPKSSSSSSRRKTGGTGRGPGRWPKGTKKSDYGNADSGPGLPPAWIKERARLAAISAGKAAEGEGSMLDSKETMDVVQVQFQEAGQDEADRVGSNGQEVDSQAQY